MQTFRRLLQQQGDIGGATRSLQPDGRANGAIAFVGEQDEAEPWVTTSASSNSARSWPPTDRGRRLMALPSHPRRGCSRHPRRW